MDVDKFNEKSICPVRIILQGFSGRARSARPGNESLFISV